jgi:hypothetical protein
MASGLIGRNRGKNGCYAVSVNAANTVPDVAAIMLTSTVAHIWAGQSSFAGSTRPRCTNGPATVSVNLSMVTNTSGLAHRRPCLLNRTPTIASN